MEACDSYHYGGDERYCYKSNEEYPPMNRSSIGKGAIIVAGDKITNWCGNAETDRDKDKKFAIEHLQYFTNSSSIDTTDTNLLTAILSFEEYQTEYTHQRNDNCQ